MKIQLKFPVRGIYCTLCQDVVVSRYRHDFRYCECKAVFIDGGQDDYYRMGGNPGDFLMVTVGDPQSTYTDAYEEILANQVETAKVKLEVPKPSKSVTKKKSKAKTATKGRLQTKRKATTKGSVT